MSFGVLSLRSPGAVTAPATVGWTLGSALAAVLRDYGPSDVIPIPSLRAMLFCDGINFQYHAIDATSYVTGPLAPPTAPTTTSTGVRATGTQTFTAATNPADNDAYTIVSNGKTVAVVFKSTLATSGNAVQIKIGASLAATIASIAAFWNNTGVAGTDYYYRSTEFELDVGAMLTKTKMSVSSTSATVVTYRYTEYGTNGNASTLTEVTDGGASWAVVTFSGGANGTHALSTWPKAGTYLHGYARVRRGDTAQTAISPRSTVDNGTESDMTVGSFATAVTRDATTHTRVLRSTVNGGEQFYKVRDTDGSSLTDSYPDSTITGEGALLYDSTKFRPYEGGYPPRRKYGALYRGSVFLTGVVPEGQRSGGTVSVTIATKTVTFSAGTHKETIIGMTLRITDKTTDYVVVDFVESTRVATLNISYVDATDATATYTLRDARNPYGIEWCVPNKVNQTPIANSLEGVSSADGLGSTGIEAAFDSLVMWTRTGLWQVQGDPASTVPRFVPVCEGVGSFCGGAVVNADGVVYWLGPDGLWGWEGSGTPTSVSNPSNPSAGSPRGISDTLARVNVEQANGIVSDYNRTENVIRWWVPLDGSTWNSHVIVYDTQTGAFAVDTSPPVTCAMSVVGSDGDYHTLVGTAFGEVYELDLSTSDAAYGFDPLANYSSHVVLTKTTTITGTTLPTTGNSLVGASVAKVSPNAWPPEVRWVSANTASAFTVASPFTTAPAAGDKFVFGAISMRVQSGKCDFGYPELPKRLASMVVSYTPQAAATKGQLWCGASVDDSDPAMKPLRSTSLPGWADLTSSRGKHLFVTNTAEGTRTQFELYALCPGFDVSVASWKCEVPVIHEVRT